MRDLMATVNAGNRAHQAVMAVDKQKGQFSKAEIERFTTAFLAAFSADCAFRLKPRIRFCDVDALIGSAAHRQLCFVEFGDGRCTMSFHETLLTPYHTSGDLIFVAKSWALLVVLEAALAQGMSSSGAFIFEVGDNGTLRSVCFCSKHPGACLILDYEFLRFAGHQWFRGAYAREGVAWSDRRDQVFWRGATTGRRLKDPPAEGEPDDLSWLQRLRLCVAAQDPAVRDHCDIGLSEILQTPEAHLRETILKAGLVKAYAHRGEFLKHRFVVDIDGNSNSWSGLFLALYGGACVLKVESLEGYRQWYYDSLQPWLNYVPIAGDLGDFGEKVDWVRRNDREAEQIARRGHELAARITLENALEVSARNLRVWLAVKSAAS